MVVVGLLGGRAGGSGGWWSPAFGQGSSLPWLVVGVGELLVAERGDAAAGVAVAAGTAGVGQVPQGCVAPLAKPGRHGLQPTLFRYMFR
jgi:hypothetical protein